MPLLDHFRPPVSQLVKWESLHSTWATLIAGAINERLSPPWRAEPGANFGIEVDVAGIERQLPDVPAGFEPPTHYRPEAPAATLELPVLTDEVVIRVFAGPGGWELVGAVELVSPANKDRPGSRDAFTAKCEAYLSRGIGVCIVDVASPPHGSLHDELIDRLGREGEVRSGRLYASAFHPVARHGSSLLDVWVESLGVGSPLPSLPLFLRDGPCVEVPLESTYTQARDLLKLDRDLALLEQVRERNPA